MLNQSFSAENLRNVYDSENRRGKGLDARFFPVLRTINQELTKAREQLRTIRRDNLRLAADKLEPLTEPLVGQIKEIRARREAALDVEMNSLSDKLSDGQYRFRLRKLAGPAGKDVYPAEDCAEAYFVSRQVQRNIARVYKVKPANRREIVQQLEQTLTGGFPLYVIKADISNFFESIPTDKLLAKISRDQLLSNLSRQHVRTAIESFRTLSQSNTGLPRGLGMTSYLVELFMRTFDETVASMANVVYHARYVDDIVVVFAPEPGDTPSRFLDAVKQEIIDLQLTPHPDKTKGYTVDASQNVCFDFLGYTFRVSGGACKLSVCRSKIDRIKRRLEATFEAFDRDRVKDHRSAFRDCVARVRFLTGNTRLTNSKSQVYTGIYYNSSSATDLSTLRGLDLHYQNRILALSSPALIASLSRYSFLIGFTQRRFVRMNSRTLGRITKVWSNEA